MKTKQTTLNDCNIGDQFTLQGNGSRYVIRDLVDFVDEQTGKQIMLVEVIKVSDKKVSYMEFNKIVNQIIK